MRLERKKGTMENRQTGRHPNTLKSRMVEKCVLDQDYKLRQSPKISARILPSLLEKE